MSGFDQLGDLIGGGLEGRKEQAFQNGRYRSAQTEDALTNARVNQAKALQAEQENAARTEIAAMAAKGGIDYTNPGNDLLSQALLGGVAKDLPSIGNFNLDAQQFRNRATLGDTEAPALNRARASDAVQGKFEGDITKVGTRGYYDRTQDDPELSVMAGLDAGARLPSSAIQNYDRRSQLKTDAERSVFDQMVRGDHYVNAGGVTVAVPGVNPGSTAVPKPVVSRGETAANAAAIQGAKTTATTQSKLQSALPGVQESLDTFGKNIQEFLDSPGFDMTYGKSAAVAGTMGPLAPEEYRNAKVLRDTLGSEAFQNSIQQMRGLGSLSNAEGLKVQSALTSALDPNQDEAQAAKSWAKLQQRLERFKRIAEVEAGMKGMPGITVGPGATPPAAAVPGAAPAGDDLSTMSDEDLRRIANGG